ncbi:MAG: hypothetical protein ACFFEY_11645 [Candidatus Thorarchaeota archaeon]
MVVKGKALVGPILGLIGSVLLIIAGIIGFTNPLIQFAMVLFPLLALSFIMPLILGGLGLLGSLLGLFGKKFGNIITLIIGIVAVIGMFIPLYFPFPLVLSLFWVDPFLILVGGILGLALKPKS